MRMSILNTGDLMNNKVLFCYISVKVLNRNDLQIYLHTKTQILPSEAAHTFITDVAIIFIPWRDGVCITDRLQ
jgi:hypothetical protein